MEKQQGNGGRPDEHQIPIQIDHKPYKAEKTPMTGAELRTLASPNVGADRDLFRVVHHRYDAFWLYHEAQKVDEWEGQGYSGTSVRAGCDILRTVGHRRIIRRRLRDPDPADGIAANRWATTVDDIRAAIAAGNPVAIGINWYSSFDNPQPLAMDARNHWIATTGVANWGSLRGGHCVCIYGASDRRRAFAVKNSWGKEYPLIWLPYYAMGILLEQYG
jgi:hypothetical protein